MEYIWKWTKATRINLKERAIGGGLLGYRSAIKLENFWDCAENCIAACEININNDLWKIITVYNRCGLERIRHQLEDLMEDNREKKCLLIGDLNARIGTLGGKFEDAQGDRLPRNTKDLVKNKEGENWIKLMDDYGLTVLNGNIEGDWAGEYTHIDYKSQSVIDYCAGNEHAWRDIQSFVVRKP